MRTKLVVMMMIDGASESTVISAASCITRRRLHRDRLRRGRFLRSHIGDQHVACGPQQHHVLSVIDAHDHHAAAGIDQQRFGDAHALDARPARLEHAEAARRVCAADDQSQCCEQREHRPRKVQQVHHRLRSGV
ncbi:MAG: hypothetical protein NT015_05060 [Alphaproteobacteria bacterium]|nr:hypothetical protein [Alphaproteobacteria bacterium]